MIDPTKFKRIPVSEATKTPTKDGEYELHCDMWWAVTENDEILIYRGFSRQCNTHKSIVEQVISSESHPGVKAEFLPAVWLNHKCSDYQ